MSRLFPWLTLVAIIWLQAISSTNTDFPAYSSQLKSRLAITQVQLNNLAVASDAGKLFGWLCGLVADSFPLWSVLAAGSAIGLVGYGVQFLFLADKIATLSYWQYVLLQLLAGNSVCWFNTACYVAAMRKFPLDSGVVIGLATSYTGLTAKMYVTMAQIVTGKRSSGGGDNSVYLLLNCAVPLGFALFAAPFLAESKPAMKGNGAGLFVVFLIACATGAYAVVQTLVPALGSSLIPPTVLLGMVGLVCLVPLLRAGDQMLRRRSRNRINAAGNVLEEVEEVRGPGGSEEVEEGKSGSGVGGEHGVWWLVRSVDFWLYFLVYLTGATMGLVFGNNLGQIAQSRRVRQSDLLSVYSSFGFFGKLSAAPLSALSRSKYMVSRPASVAILMVPMAGSFFLLLIPNTISLFVGTAIIGACSGAITSIAVSMTSDLFGPQHFSVNHNIVVANIPLGSLVFGYISAIIYDQEGGGAVEGSCVGVRCYRKTFLVWGSICTLGTVMSFILYIRTKKLLTRN
ncbi:protein NUCLEAR FUSION DEFECTIVE 4-like [Iris pallida]|uniref:Protein NUCLEAR FUSION DEFECTIVE 4-like n=1 Tax=Iris pallida TaxID=29817 RepID=A0AAX6G0L7_IRIPA|nr:protein NUCLEAR FUSION DEFECTIVE 4-like [Iris pallida]